MKTSHFLFLGIDLCLQWKEIPKACGSKSFKGNLLSKKELYMHGTKWSSNLG